MGMGNEAWSFSLTTVSMQEANTIWHLVLPKYKEDHLCSPPRDRNSELCRSKAVPSPPAPNSY